LPHERNCFETAAYRLQKPGSLNLTVWKNRKALTIFFEFPIGVLAAGVVIPVQIQGHYHEAGIRFINRSNILKTAT